MYNQKRIKAIAETTMMVTGVSFMGALGMVGLWSGIIRMDVSELNPLHFCGILFGLFGGIAGCLLLRIFWNKNAKSSK